LKGTLHFRSKGGGGGLDLYTRRRLWSAENPSNPRGRKEKKREELGTDAARGRRGGDKFPPLDD